MRRLPHHVRRFLSQDSAPAIAMRRGMCIALPLSVGGVMSLVRLLGFTTLACGCVVGRYREVATSREVAYTIVAERFAAVTPIALATKAS
jgi:hypothetical protein